MKIPAKVRIGGREYAVKETENLNDGVNMAYGHIDYEQGVIRITKGLGHDKKCITLWHEMLHGISEHFGLKIEDEEEVVTVFCKRHLSAVGRQRREAVRHHFRREDKPAL